MKKLWIWFRSPSQMAVGSLLIIGGLGGILFWGGFSTFMEYTNTLEFCTSCHEMTTVYDEYTHSIHYENQSGVRAVCSDCHVPKPWTAKLIRKIQASKEIYHKLQGSIDTPEKFMAKRLQLANIVWRSMKQTDSRECRNCHAYDSMTVERQKNDARFWHPMAIDEGFTCIDCHKGIAHHMPDMDRLVSVAAQVFSTQLTEDPLNTSILFTAVSKTLFGAPGIKSAQLAQIIPGSRLQVDERKAGWLKVRLQGQVLLEDERYFYSDKLSGVVNAEVSITPQYTHDMAVTDTQTRLSWRPAQITGWVSS
jgi:trimethylamine-N-oxide reductase cytochrome c-type subunit TorC